MAQPGSLGVNPSWLGLHVNPAAGFGGTALGDSGGPVLLTDPETGAEVLVGVTAWGGNSESAHYWRADTATSLQFIKGVIGSLETK